MPKQPLAISEDLVSRFCQFVSDGMGVYFPKEGLSDFEKKIPSITKAFGFKDSCACMEWLMQEPLNEEKISTLAEFLTVGETYFFRDAGSFKTMKEKLLPEIINARRGKDQHIRIWCAACCTGEEPYSIAILLHQLLPDLENWNISILGTDINSQFLHKARTGSYKEWSFRTTPKEIKEHYFKKSNDGRYALIPEIRKLVKFMYLNLVEDAYPSLVNGTNGMDIILCNNVLIYFSENNIKTVIRQIGSSLIDGGWLFVSAIEVPYVHDPRFTTAKFFDTTIFNKGNKCNVEISQANAPSFFECMPAKEKKLVSEEVGLLKVELPAFLNLTQPILEFDFSIGKDIPSPNKLEKEFSITVAKSPESLSNETPQIAELIDQFQKGLYTDVALALEEKLNPIQHDIQSLNQHLKEVVLLSQTYANQGNLISALKWCEKALAADKLDPILYFLQASILLELERIPEAKEFCKRALYLDPRFVLAEFTMGNLLIREGNSLEAKRHLRNTLMLLKNYAEADCLPAGEGMTAGNLSEIVKTMQERMT